jgi:hypothetical protein
MTLGEISKECKLLENDPWDYSEQAALEAREPWTQTKINKQREVYNKLPNTAEKCFLAVQKKIGNLKQITSTRSPTLETIEE